MSIRDITSIKELLAEWDKFDGGGKNLAAIRALCLEDRYYLLVKVLGRIDLLHQWSFERCREVESNPDGHLDLWAREHGKSSIITFGGIIQEVLKNPEITIGIFSHNAKLSRGFLAQIKRELEGNTTLLQCFPDILWKDTRQSPSWSVENGITVKRKSNPKEATVEASGLVDGQPIGKHYDLRVYDDVVTNESVYTPEQITKTTDAYSLSQALGKQGGRVWGIGTRYSYADTYEWIMKRNSLVPRVYPATKNGEPEGETVLFTQEEWEKRKRDHTDGDIACQYLQNPLSGEQRMFNIKDLQEYEIRPRTLTAYVLCDPARSKKKDSANTAIVVIGLDYAGNKYLLDGMNHRMDLQERWSNFSMLFYKWLRSPGIQSIKAGYESFGAIADLDYFKEQMKIKGQTFQIDELAWPRDGEGSKVDRVQRLVPDFKGNKIYLPYPTNDARLTSAQKQALTDGYGYAVSKQIKRKDSDGNVYDLTEQFKLQAHYFPFGGLKDLIDAFSRLYDMEPKPPIYVDETSLEPDYI